MDVKQSQSEVLTRALTPNAVMPRQAVWLVVGAWFVVWLAYWTLARPAVFPSPLDVVGALPDLWTQDGLGPELWTSISTSLEAVAWSTAIALPLAYLSRVPAVEPLAAAAANLRFLSPAVFYLLFLFVASSAHMVKVWLLVLGEATYLLTSMVDVVANIPQEKWDDARTLGMSEWLATWYVAVRGTLDEALAAIRANAAMGWAAIIFVEGLVRSEGGVGVLILNSERHMSFDAIWAVAGCILAWGLLQDRAFGWLSGKVCPWKQ